MFFTLVVGYCLYYAPFGVNETDGGFLTGLAWQVLNGKVLYHDIVYVRPPLPVWLRAMELQILPEHLAVLGERWIFYIKIALYSWLGAAVLTLGERRWVLAVFGFVVSAHCYPPMAWHTVDGILFAVMAAFFATEGGMAFRPSGEAAFTAQTNSFRGVNASGPDGLKAIPPLAALAGVCLFCALLCKQSFYPLLPLFALFLFLEKENRWRKTAWFFGVFLLCTVLFSNYLYQNNTLSAFFQMTSGAASGGQALQHGILDYFRITPELALPSILLLIPVAWWFWKGKNPRLALMAWSMWLIALVTSYAAITWLRQDHTVPFAQSRVMFWVAVFWTGFTVLTGFTGWTGLRGVGFFWTGFTGWTGLRGVLFRKKGGINPVNPVQHIGPSVLLLGITWCASVSWGYNLPILFATPWVWAGMEITTVIAESVKPYRFVMLLFLLLSFRVGHEFVYRDGRRSEMQVPMGSIFPALSGIYSDPETAELYRDLKQLVVRYGPNFKTLPAFPQANFLTKTSPPLPLDWVVNRETNGDNTLIFKNLKEIQPVVFIQKSFREKIESDPEMEVVRKIFQNGKVVAETKHFWVIETYDLLGSQMPSHGKQQNFDE